MSPRRRPDWVPKLSWFSPRRCGRVRIPGKGTVYLGGRDSWKDKHRPPPRAVTEAYNAEIAAWVRHRGDDGRGQVPAPGARLTLYQLAASYLRRCRSWYTKRGETTSHYGLIRVAVGELLKLFGRLPAEDFTRQDLKAYRGQLENSEKVGRATINRKVRLIQQMFAWAVDEDLIPEDVALKLKAVRGLQKGRTPARESSRKRVPTDAEISKTIAQLPPLFVAMVKLQTVTGMRPIEVRSMRAGDVRREAALWVYTVRDDANKTAHMGIPRVVFMGKQAQKILAPWLDVALTVGHPDAPVFPSFRLGRIMARETYQDNVRAAARRAGVKPWTPGSLRHFCATKIRQQHGIEAAQAYLGHDQPGTTEIYTHAAKEELARKIAGAEG